MKPGKPKKNETLPKYLARYLFEIGDDPGVKTYRMAYKTLRHPGMEVENGGLCEAALAHALQTAIKEYEAANSGR